MDIDLSFKNKKKPTEGSILISDPFLDEDFFRRSIVLLCSHSDEEGSIGLVLNNYLEIDLHEVEHTFPDIQARISIGGPVDTEHLFFIHSYGDAVNGATKISGNLFFGGDFEELKNEIEKNTEHKEEVRFFLGYSGWSQGQLADELKENSWIVADNIQISEILDTTNNEFWKYCLEKQGKRFETIAKFPLHPNDN